MVRIQSLANRVVESIYEIGSRIKRNRAQLRKGTVLDPMNHPSYSEKKIEAIKAAEAYHDKTIKAAYTHYENAVAVA